MRILQGREIFTQRLKRLERLSETEGRGFERLEEIVLHVCHCTDRHSKIITAFVTLQQFLEIFFLAFLRRFGQSPHATFRKLKVKVRS